MEAFEIAKRDGKLNEVLLEHKVSKFTNPALAGRLVALVNEYRLLGQKRWEELDTHGEYKEDVMKPFILEMIKDNMPKVEQHVPLITGGSISDE